MNLNVSFQSLTFSFVLVLIGIFISYKEKIGTVKEIIYSISRAIIQLIIVGYVLTYLFNLNNVIVTLAMVAVIGFNASWNATKRSNNLDNAFKISLISIFAALSLSLGILILSGSIKFIPSQVVPISGMIAGNAMTALGLTYRNLNSLFRDQRQQLLEKMALGATPKQASKAIINEAIKLGMQPTLDSAKTIGIVSLPGMMSGLMFAGTKPSVAIMYQIMVTFMLVSTTSIASYLSVSLAYKAYFNDKQQLI
ncbi:MAG TPA: iron export ABC transporter permease subunit FetB [Erysipelothrix sp.]